jgi:hypothetical protein
VYYAIGTKLVADECCFSFLAKFFVAERISSLECLIENLLYVITIIMSLSFEVGGK